MLYDRKSGEKKNLTENFDRWVGNYIWSKDSKKIYFTYENAGRTQLEIADIDKPVTPPSDWSQAPAAAPSGYADDLALSPDGQTLFFTFMTLEHPTEIYRAGFANPAHIPVTHYQRRVILSEVAMSPLEPFWFTGAHNDKVEGFIVKPPNFDASKKYPGEVPDPRRPARCLGRRLELSLESRTVRRTKR